MSETNIAQLPAVQQVRQVRVVEDPIAVLDTARFEHMQRIAKVMAQSMLIPDALCMTGPSDARVMLPFDTIVANCFLVVNQAVRWRMDPFAVAQCVSVVHGKLCYEGKLIAAVLESGLGIDLEYDLGGEADKMSVVVTAATKDGKAVLDSKNRPKSVKGSVADWKTTGAGSPWGARGGHERMLCYRGAREWCRRHAPGLMLGVYSTDEMLGDVDRADEARDVSPKKSPPPPTQIGVRPIDQVRAEPAKELHSAPQTQKKAPPPPDASAETKSITAPAIPSTDDPEAFRTWVKQTLDAITDQDKLESTFNDLIAPRIEGIFPSDYDDVLALYRDAERRLAP